MRQFATTLRGDGYGNAVAPETLPGKEALKLTRMARAVELLVQHPAPSVKAIGDDLGVSRATVYRMLADPDFQALLRKALSGRLAMLAKRAMDRVEDTLENGIPGLRYRAAVWILERFEKVSAVVEGDAEQRRCETARAKLGELMEGIRRTRQTVGLLASEPASTAGNGVEVDRAAGDELADAELDGADPALDEDGIRETLLRNGWKEPAIEEFLDLRKHACGDRAP